MSLVRIAISLVLCDDSDGDEKKKKVGSRNGWREEQTMFGDDVSQQSSLDRWRPKERK